MQLAFILSTGRTGTQFFESYINQSSTQAVCRHEPKPSRRFKFLSNLYLTGRFQASTAAHVYAQSRRKMWQQLPADTLYIESNNFLFGLMQPLQARYRDVRVLHIVRHPATYMVSHLNHGFWRGFKRFTARYVPWWLEELPLNRAQKQDPLFLLAARWQYVNNQIASYQATMPYLRVRFEDLFAAPPTRAAETLETIRTFLSLPALSEKENLQYLQQPRNQSKRHDTRYAVQPGHLRWLQTHARVQLKEYGYYPIETP